MFRAGSAGEPRRKVWQLTSMFGLLLAIAAYGWFTALNWKVSEPEWGVWIFRIFDPILASFDPVCFLLLVCNILFDKCGGKTLFIFLFWFFSVVALLEFVQIGIDVFRVWLSEDREEQTDLLVDGLMLLITLVNINVLHLTSRAHSTHNPK